MSEGNETHNVNDENYQGEERLDENYQGEEGFNDNYQEEEGFNDNYQEEEDEFNEDDGNESWYDGVDSTNVPSLDISDDEDEIDPVFSRLLTIENSFKAYMYGIECVLSPNKTFNLRIPRTFLPITLQVAYGFTQSEIALDLTVYFTDNWNSPYSRAIVVHPISGPIYTGSVLVKDSINKFFQKDYQPKSYYRSAPFFFYSSTTPDPSKVTIIEKKGFTAAQAKRTLSLCRNNVEESLQFLRTGQINMSEHLEDAKPPLSYRENPLIYLVLEIADSVFDVQDHCSICREPISPGIKPATCEKESCKYAYAEMGVGISLLQEIKRDIYVADLLYTSFLCALETEFLTPAPPNFRVSDIKKIINKIPPFQNIITFSNDLTLCDVIGAPAYNLLRWIILSNRSQLFHLPHKIQLPMIADKGCFQFMALISSPDQENVFQQLKAKYKSIFVWHGSSTDRWHSIIRNGLVNASNTKLMKCGAAYGPGIYLAKSSSVSLGYAVSSLNPWKGSRLGQNFSVIALCEVVNLPSQKEITETVYVSDPNTGTRVKKHVSGKLSDFGSILTLTMEEACIVRFVIVNLRKQFDIYSNPPHKLPTLVDVLESHLV